MILSFKMKDLDITAKSLLKCREIKQEILRFGINQLEIQQLIKLLALELEDREKMERLSEVTKSLISEKGKKNNKLITSNLGE